MNLYPAIDIKDGRCVRLLRGDMDSATVYADNPVEQARHFESLGFGWLHIVDLNGAVTGRSVNGDIIEKLISDVRVPVQLGGGIRDMAAIEFWLNRGVKRVILGTSAVRQPDMVLEACRRFPQQIVIGIDARDGMVATEGWTENSTIKALDLALKFENANAAAIIYTDIQRDGALQGLNIEATIDLAFAITTPVIASGGLATLDDLATLKEYEYDKAGIDGVIMGRALYDGRINPADAIRLFQQS